MVTSTVILHDSSAFSLEERLTAQFYAWERRGRGWQISLFIRVHFSCAQICFDFVKDVFIS